MNELVSIVVVTRNEEEAIERLLFSIQRQTYPYLETILVDNYSTDNTYNIAKKFATKLAQAGPERSRQRNIGAKLADGEYLIFLDADMELPPTLIESTVQALFSREDIKFLAIPEYSIGENYWSRCKALERNCYLDAPEVMAARVFRRDFFFFLNGFNEMITGFEDWDLSQRAEEYGELHIHDEALLHHEGSIHLISQAKKKYYYAKSFSIYQQHHPEHARAQANLLLRKAYIRHWQSFALQPHLALGFVILRAVESLAALTGILYSKLRE